MIKFIARRCDSILKIIIFILVSYYGFLITKHIHFDDKTNAFMVKQMENKTQGKWWKIVMINKVYFVHQFYEY